MTAEIAVMNKLGVALAADSAATISGTNSNKKTYNTVNKLFALSKYNPVGIMIYGKAEFLGVPWETIIKLYREHIGHVAFDTIEQYMENFIQFIKACNAFTDEIQTHSYFQFVYAYLYLLRDQVDKRVAHVIENDGSIGLRKVNSIIKEVIDENWNDWNDLDDILSYNKSLKKTLLKDFESDYDECIKNVFENHKLAKSIINKLKDIFVFLHTKNRLSESYSGVVIAGFGTKEIYPSLCSIKLEQMIKDNIKYIYGPKSSITIKNDAVLFPFAQQEMVSTFMNGVDEQLYNSFLEYLSLLIELLPDLIDQNLNLSSVQKNELENFFDSLHLPVLENASNHLKTIIEQCYSSPVLEAISALPKDDLAAVAEALVNLTSFKRKVSIDLETVGGPIDVAIISKGDGFVWIKRKHYFNPDLNFQFFANYYKSNGETK